MAVNRPEQRLVRSICVPSSSFGLSLLEQKNSYNGFVSLGPRRFMSLKAPGTMESRWRKSTARLLDREINVLGSFDSLKWHQAETMIIYWAEKGVEGLGKCFLILDRLVDEAAANNESNFKLDIYLIHVVLKSWKQHFQKFQIDLLPSQVLEKIETYSSKSQIFEPNIATYTMILDGASHCPSPSERILFTEELLGRLLEESDTNPQVRPTVVTFSTVIKAWARSGSSSTAEKAEALLRRVQELSENEWPDVKPNAVMYTSVIHAWANAGDPDRAELLLKQMYEDYMLNGNSEVKPNKYSFNTVLAAWAKSPSQNALDSAETLLRKMIELNDTGVLDSRPDVGSYNCLLNALSRRTGSVQTVSKAESLMQEMDEAATKTGDKSILPNLITYTALFRILAATDLPDTADRVEMWLKRAKDQGISDDRFLLDQFLTKAQKTRVTQEPNQ